MLIFQKNKPVFPFGEREGVREGDIPAARAAVRAKGHDRAAAGARRRRRARRRRPPPPRRRLPRGLPRTYLITHTLIRSLTHLLM